MSVRILLVDDTPEVLALCAEILKREIVGTAGDGKSGVAAVERTSPDVVVLGIAMPRLNGIEVAKRLRSSGLPGGDRLFERGPGIDERSDGSGRFGVCHEETAHQEPVGGYS